MKKIKTGYVLLGSFVLLMWLLFASNYLNKSNEAALDKNGREAIAKITNIKVNNYKANEMEGRYIENYVLTYQFSSDDGKVITSVRTIEKKDYKNYFDRGLVVNDDIKILYDPSSPGNNKVKKLKKN